MGGLLPYAAGLPLAFVVCAALIALRVVSQTSRKLLDDLSVEFSILMRSLSDGVFGTAGPKADSSFSKKNEGSHN